MNWNQWAFSASHSAREHALDHLDAGRRGAARSPLPFTSGFGSAEPTKTRRTPASSIAIEQGGVFP